MNNIFALSYNWLFVFTIYYTFLFVKTFKILIIVCTRMTVKFLSHQNIILFFDVIIV